MITREIVTKLGNRESVKLVCVETEEKDYKPSNRTQYQKLVDSYAQERIGYPTLYFYHYSK